MRRYKNANMKPDKHATYLRISAIKQQMWPVEAVQEHLESITPAELQGEVDDGLNVFSFLWLVACTLQKWYLILCATCLEALQRRSLTS